MDLDAEPLTGVPPASLDPDPGMLSDLTAGHGPRPSDVIPGAAAPSLFTPEQLKDDGKNRVGKTGLQIGLGSAIVTIVTAVLHGRGWLHAGPDGTLLDSVVKDAYNLVVGTAIATAMNFSKLRGKS